MTAKELGQRTAVAGVGIPLAVLLIISGGWGLTLGMTFISVMVTRELFFLGEPAETRAFSWIGMAASGALVLLTGAQGTFSASAPWILGVLVGVFLLISTLALKLRWPEGRPLSAISLTMLGVILGGGCLSFALLLRHVPLSFGGEVPWGLSQGFILLAFPLTVTWLGDSAALFAGKAWGKKKLIPAVSPAKTVVGSVAEFIAGLLVGIWVGWFFLQFHPNLWVSVGLGAGMGLILAGGAQLGDLAESVLKREAGVKDSGRLIPGHGGFLDRFDSLIFNLPLAYLLIQMVGLLQ